MAVFCHWYKMLDVCRKKKKGKKPKTPKEWKRKTGSVKKNRNARILKWSSVNGVVSCRCSKEKIFMQTVDAEEEGGGGGGK